MATAKAEMTAPVSANGKTEPAHVWPHESIVALNLWQRLLMAQASAKGLAKHGTAPQIMGGFHFATDADVADAAREYLTRFGISYTPSMRELRSSEGGTTSTQKPIYRTDVCVVLTIRNVDQPLETDTVEWFGRGDDTADKGIGKAGTSAIKNAFIKLLNLQGDPLSDPDAADATGGEDRAARGGSAPSADWQPVTRRPVQSESASGTWRHERDGREPQGPPCPTPDCTGHLVQRATRTGKNPGSPFLVCDSGPNGCGMKPIWDTSLEDYVKGEADFGNSVDVPILGPGETRLDISPEQWVPSSDHLNRAPTPVDAMTVTTTNAPSDIDYIVARSAEVPQDKLMEAFTTGALVACLSKNGSGWFVERTKIEHAPKDRLKLIANCLRLAE